MDPFPQLNSIFGMAIQHENLNGLATDDQSSSALINLAKKPYNGSYSKGNDSNLNRSCTHCGRGNHTINTCFKKHGYPPGFRFRDGTVVGGKAHGGSSINNVDYANEEGVAKPAVENDSHVAALSTEEYQALMALLKSRKIEASSSYQINSLKNVASSSSNNQQGTVISAFCFSIVGSLDTWILDSGATYHVCSSLSLFTRYHTVHPIHVKLSNGSIVSTYIVGDINVTSHITLHNVLYVAKFSFNLISISKVSQDLNCAFVFTDNVCYIQNSM
jgi:hypothetical protein